MSVRLLWPPASGGGRRGIGQGMGGSVVINAADQSVGAPTPATTGAPVLRSRARSRDNYVAWRLIGLAMLGHMLRSRRFYERMAFAAIVLAAIGRLSRENRARTLSRLAAWDKRQVQLLERKAEREARRLQRTAKGVLTRSR